MVPSSGRAGREQLLSCASSGQLDDRDLEAIVVGIVRRERWATGRDLSVVEVGTGGGEGSTVALHRALTATKCRFQLVGYEGAPELAANASRYWSNTKNVHVVNEYFMHREDIERTVTPQVAPTDRHAYLPVFAAIAQAENFLQTTPPAPIDLLFIDSFRYTHLAILLTAQPWLQPGTVVVMEDDIAEYGELAIVQREFKPRKLTRHEIDGLMWPFAEFKIAPKGRIRRALQSVAARQ